MDYFVAIQNTNYYYWQLELLIQSFKKLNIQNQLVVAITPALGVVFPEFQTNSAKHPRLFVTKDNNRTNTIQMLIALLEQKALNQPFAYLHPDMVMLQPLEKHITIPSTFIGFDPETIHPNILNTIQTELNKIYEIKKIQPNHLQTGSVIIFNGMPIDFFYRVYQRTIELIELYGTNWGVEKAAMLLTLYENVGLFNCTPTPCTLPMTAHVVNRPIIHYKYGITPDFNKIFFKYPAQSPIITISAQTPFEAILKQTPYTATQHMQELTRTYLK